MTRIAAMLAAGVIGGILGLWYGPEYIPHHYSPTERLIFGGLMGFIGLTLATFFATEFAGFLRNQVRWCRGR